jgi:hypothetical protein
VLVELPAYLNLMVAFNLIEMTWYTILASIALLVCVVGCLSHFLKLIKLGKPKDFSAPAGEIKDAVKYSFTKAMMPSHKESAYLHLPEYSAGILFHIGAFISLFLFILNLVGIFFYAPFIIWSISGVLIITSICGLYILIARFFNKVQQQISNPDDYISNFLVTTFQILTILMLHFEIHAIYFVFVSVLLFYLPFGKLKHVVYFFAARYHLGFFYGWRGTWPPKNN